MPQWPFMRRIFIYPTAAPSPGAYHFGCRWYAQVLSALASGFVLNLLDGASNPDQINMLRRMLTYARLVGKDRTDEAREIIARLHSDGDRNAAIVNLQMAEISESIRTEGLLTFTKMFDLRVLVKTRARRYRIGLNIAFSWFGQFSGNNIASYCKSSSTLQDLSQPLSYILLLQCIFTDVRIKTCPTLLPTSESLVSTRNFF